MDGQGTSPPPEAFAAPPGVPLRADPEVMGGRMVFAGTRVPVEVLSENLADGLTVDEIVDSYPTLRKEDVLRVLAEASVMSAAAGASGHGGCVEEERAASPPVFKVEP